MKKEKEKNRLRFKEKCSHRRRWRRQRRRRPPPPERPSVPPGVIIISLSFFLSFSLSFSLFLSRRQSSLFLSLSSFFFDGSGEETLASALRKIGNVFFLCTKISMAETTEVIEFDEQNEKNSDCENLHFEKKVSWIYLFYFSLVQEIKTRGKKLTFRNLHLKVL